ncbi:fimbrial protein [Salmonella enterica]|nr:fimbrial protein [Salmonella enterica]
MDRNRMVMAATLVLVVAAVAGPGHAAGAEEKRLHLGVVNGQVRDGRTVEVQRTPGDPVLYQTGSGEAVPGVLRIRNAEARSGERGTLNVTVKASGPQPGEASLAVSLTQWVDGRRQAMSWQRQGMDVLVEVPPGATQVALRAEGPVTLRVPAEWRGAVEIPLDVSGEGGG